MKTLNAKLLLSVGALAALSAGAAALGVLRADHKLQRRIEVPEHAITVPTDAAAIERGRYLFASRGCADCHGADGAGRTFINDPGGLRIHAPNITGTPGAAVAAYRSEDWVRTIRHGVKPDGRPVFVMPSEDYNRLTNADTGALIAYLQQLPELPGEGMRAQVPLVVRLAYGFGVMKDAAEKIDHQRPPATAVPEGVTPEHGAYVANVCIGCHGPGLGGGKIPGAPPSWPAASNLTPGSGSVLPIYTDSAAFVAMMRSGKRPDGTTVSAEMPFNSFRAMSEVDLLAVHQFLRALPPRTFGSR